jgi:uncharacterized protein involved in outer membrane biogenesis
MRKLFKISLLVFLAIVLFIILIPIVFRGKIKEMVLNEANKSLNAKLEVGKVNLSLLKSFPNVYVGLHDVIITGQGKFEADTLIKVRSLSISTGIMDLIGGSPYEIKKIKIDQADVRLKVLADEQANWDIVKPSESGTAEKTTLAAYHIENQHRYFKDLLP